MRVSLLQSLSLGKKIDRLRIPVLERRNLRVKDIRSSLGIRVRKSHNHLLPAYMKTHEPRLYDARHRSEGRERSKYKARRFAQNRNYFIAEPSLYLAPKQDPRRQDDS